MKQIQKKTNKEVFREFRRSPIYFINVMWGLTPQPLKEEYKDQANIVGLQEFKKDWFEPFIKGKHITWQQWVILLGVERSLRGAAPKRITVRSGHGVGKDTTLAWLILWYLFCFKNAQIPCTAPTSEQIHDILWKEIAIWLGRMPEAVADKYEWNASYVRVKESPDTWFARARTARKENPEALAGVHGDFVFFVVDEASGVPEEIFKPAEGALTNENVLVVMVSNPRRLIGYFYDSHHADKNSWQCLQFNSMDSPIVDSVFVKRVEDKWGKESDEYAYMVAGAFPQEEAVDDQGYTPLFKQLDLREIQDIPMVGFKKMGIDPSGGGKNETTWVVRDQFKMKVVHKEKISTGKGIAQKTVTLMDMYGFKKENAKKEITIDGFGVGVEAVQELALAGVDVNAVNVGEKPLEQEDADRYLNVRAMAFDKFKSWLRAKGELIAHADWKQLLVIRYRRELSGKMSIMPKKLMKALGFSSPDVADGGMLTFVTKDVIKKKARREKKERASISDYQGKRGGKVQGISEYMGGKRNENT